MKYHLLVGSIYQVEESDGTVSSFLQGYDIYYYLEDEGRLLQAPVRICYCQVNNCFAWGEDLETEHVHEDYDFLTPEKNRELKEYYRMLNALFTSRKSLAKCIACKSERMLIAADDGDWHPHPGKESHRYRILQQGIGCSPSHAYHFLSRDGVRLELPEEFAWALTEQVAGKKFADIVSRESQ